ncbi:hypothetical protein [Microbacterium sp.]|uniref:hypothetical protein n=1 Tax=Microbacterium sp. TaxID=51671 RepID=UPI003A8EE3C9
MTDDQLNEPAADAAEVDAAPVDAAQADAAAADAAPVEAVSTHGDAADVAPVDAAPVQYGVGPFSLREVILVGVWLVAFVVSFFSTTSYVFSSVWTHGIDWILAIGVPTVAVFLLVLRRLSPTGIRRVGSLGIDQFASVAFSVGAVVWLQMLWWQVAVVVTGGGARTQGGLVVVAWVTTWVPWVEFVLLLAGVVLTVLAPLIPGLRDDFQHRPETVSHRIARLARPVSVRPRSTLSPVPAGSAAAAETAGPPAAEQVYADGTTAPAFAAPAAGVDAEAAPAAGVDAEARAADAAHQPASEPGDVSTGAEPTGDVSTGAEPTGDARTSATASDTDATTAVTPSAQQAFWALVPEERDVVDENGAPLFQVGPTAWALVIEDRGGSFLVRHDDGRTGVLADVSGVIRG